MLVELLAPNLHVALIHYPLGLLVAGVLIETFAFLGWRRSSFRDAGRWMVGVGAVGGVAAAFSGIYALRAVARSGADRWADVRATSPVLSDGHVWHLLKTHTLYQSVAAAAAMAAVVVWLGCSDRGRKALHLPVLLVLLASVGGMTAGAWFGGEAIYRHGVSVEVAAVTKPPGETVLAADKTAPAADDPAPAIPEPTKVEQLFPPVELHVLMAGLLTGIALVSIGLSARQVTAAHELADDRRPLRPGGRLPGADFASELAGELAYDPHVPQPPSAVALARSFNPVVEVRVRPRVPAARFWLLAVALAAATSAGGWFVLARSADIDLAPRHLKTVPAQLWDQVRPHKGQPITQNRLLAHAASGTAIVVIPVVLALLARFAPRQRILLAACTLALLAAVSAQVWLGVLLLYDGSVGPITRFNPPPSGESVVTADRSSE